MHFGGTIEGYSGVAAGWVFEPMNVCVQPFFGEDEQNNRDWVRFGDSIVQLHRVNIIGVPRIWTEHISGEETDSNPNHAVEIHPITRLNDGAQERNFVPFIFAPEGFGGISENTEESILDSTTVSARRSGALVRITMKTGGLIGNFADLDVTISATTVKAFTGGHRTDGEAEIEGGGSFPVSMVSVSGTDIDSRIVQVSSVGGEEHFEVLALFSLSPVALLDAAQSGGKVQHPIQLILYGETDLRK
jgi:hypothetical protein